MGTITVLYTFSLTFPSRLFIVTNEIAPSQILNTKPQILRRERNDGIPKADSVRLCGCGLHPGGFRCNLACIFASAAHSQTVQQRVYGSSSATTTTSILPAYNKDSTTGALSLLAGALFANRLEGGLIAIDGQGKFLFVLNPISDNISMFQIDGSTGALAEVPNSPFAAGPTVNPSVAPSQPISLAEEKSGNFLYVGYANGNSSTTAALVPFAIDAPNLRLMLPPATQPGFWQWRTGANAVRSQGTASLRRAGAGRESDQFLGGYVGVRN